jgi:predicted transposase/invertase (TIGR01784 family)
MLLAANTVTRQFPKAAEDYSNPLYCWCKPLYEMYFNKKLPSEVFDMEPRIREFAENNADEATASPKVLQSPYDQFLADFREMSIMQGLKMEAIEQGIKQGIEGVARRMLKNGRSIEMIMEGTGLTREHVESLRT